MRGFGWGMRRWRPPVGKMATDERGQRHVGRTAPASPAPNEAAPNQTSERGGCGHGEERIDPSKKLDYKRELKELYGPRAGHPAIVDVPELSFLMVDGMGDPNTSRDYREAVEALFAVSYGVKFAVKRGAMGSITQ